MLKEAEHQELGFTNAALGPRNCAQLEGNWAKRHDGTVWPEFFFFFPFFIINHINIDDSFTEDLPSNKRQTEAGHVLPLADSAEDDSEAVVTLLNYPKRVVSREKPRPKSAFLPLLQQKTAMHLDIKGVFALNASWCKTWTR